MEDRVLYLYLRARNAVKDVLTGEQSEAGLSKLAITVILLAVGVAITLAVVGVIGPKIMELTRKTGENIDGVPLQWGQ